LFWESCSIVNPGKYRTKLDTISIHVLKHVHHLGVNYSIEAVVHINH
jgi:hypothetical protein